MALSTSEAKMIRELITQVNSLNARVRQLEIFAHEVHDAVPGFVAKRIEMVPAVQTAQPMNARKIDSAPMATEWGVPAQPFDVVGDEYG